MFRMIAILFILFLLYLTAKEAYKFWKRSQSQKELNDIKEEEISFEMRREAAIRRQVLDEQKDRLEGDTTEDINPEYWRDAEEKVQKEV